jgi:hypothetical protein
VRSKARPSREIVLSRGEQQLLRLASSTYKLFAFTLFFWVIIEIKISFSTREEAKTRAAMEFLIATKERERKYEG